MIAEAMIAAVLEAPEDPLATPLIGARLTLPLGAGAPGPCRGAPQGIDPWQAWRRGPRPAGWCRTPRFFAV